MDVDQPWLKHERESYQNDNVKKRTGMQWRHLVVSDLPIYIRSCRQITRLQIELEGPPAFSSVSSERHWQSGVNGIAKVPKRKVFRSGILTRPGTVRSPVQANTLTHSATAPPYPVYSKQPILWLTQEWFRHAARFISKLSNPR